MRTFNTVVLPGLCLPILAGLLQCCQAAARPVPGDPDYEPEYVLMITEQDVVINCETRRSVVYNGTFPGPALYLKEGQTTWIRAYNYISDKNTTVVWLNPQMQSSRSLVR